MRTTSLAQASSCASKLKVLADPTRLAVLDALSRGACRVGKLSRRLKVEQSLLSHHLHTLRQAGMVQARRDGKSVLYSLSAEATVSRRGMAFDLGCCQIRFD